MDDSRQPLHNLSRNPQPRASRQEPDSQLPLWLPEETPAMVPPPAETAVAETPPETIWDFADLGWFLVFAVASFLLLASLLATGYSLLRETFGWTARPEVALSRVPVMLALQVAVEVLCALFIYLTITRKYRRKFWPAIRWIRLRGQETSYLLAGFALAIALQLFSSLFPPEEHLPIEDWFTTATSAYLVALVGIGIAPFIEELVFRGFFYPVFERRWGLRPAVFLTALLFAVIHGAQLAWSWKEVSVIFVVGLLLSYVRGRTGSLVPPYLMHLAYNTSLFVSLYLATNRFRELPG